MSNTQGPPQIFPSNLPLTAGPSNLTRRNAQTATTRPPPSYGAQNTTAPANQPSFPPQQQQQQQQPRAYPSNAQNKYLPPGAAPPQPLGSQNASFSGYAPDYQAMPRPQPSGGFFSAGLIGTVAGPVIQSAFGGPSRGQNQTYPGFDMTR